MRSRLQRLSRAEQGAIMAQVGICVFVLMAFNVFVLDYGLLWIARGQAQHAADAGALAGAVARGYDDRVDPPSATGLAAQIAHSVAQTNLIWQQAGAPVVSFACPAGVTGRCTRVDVYRDGSNGSGTVDTLFGPILGVNSQQVRATATALTANGNSSPCVRPLAFADGWNVENHAPDDEFNRFVGTAPTPDALYPDADDYTPPSTGPGPGYPGETRVSRDYNYRIIWDLAHATNPAVPITRRLAVPLVLPGGGTFHDNMTQCSGNTVALNQTLNIDTVLHPSLIGVELNNVIAQDSGATYNYDESRIINSCAPDCAPISPRLIPIVLYDPEKFQLGRATGNWTDPRVGCPTNQPCVTIANIVGFFVHGTAGGYREHGHVLRYPGVTLPTVTTFVDDASWLVTTHLIR